MQGEPGREALREVVGNGEFFLMSLPDGSRVVHPIASGVRHPLNFGREVRSASSSGLPVYHIYVLRRPLSPSALTLLSVTMLAAFNDPHAL